MTLSIHLGAHKTASTHLQRSIGAIEADLLESNVIFLGPDILRDAPLDLRALLEGPERRRRQSDMVSRLLRGFLAEHRDMILSDELILGGLGRARLLGDNGRIYLGAAQRLRNLLDLLGTGDATLYLAIRSPADFVTSLFGEQLRWGGVLRIEDFLGDFDPAGLSWSDLVRRLLATGEAGRIVCWRYEDTATTRLQLLTRMLGPGLAALVPDLPPARIGLSVAAYNMVLARAAEGQPIDLLVGQSRKQHPRTRGEDRLRLLPPEIHAAAARRYAEDCAELARIPGVEFLVPGAAGCQPLKAAG
ncbi:hypothetical protein [Paracoccus sp. (in: a-proteobacteria)]|uniref:hypothetical protein n=1 Tax=Paracoccus sp. TaxID=267 RepID=UPI003A88363F